MTGIKAVLTGIFLLLVQGFLLAACAPASDQGGATDAGAEYSESAKRPGRIISLDYCADQYVLRLVDRERVLAISPDAHREFSFMRDAAEGYPRVRPTAEDVLVLRPDLVVRAYGGGPNAKAFFEKAGVPVLEVGWAPDIPAVMSVIERMAEGLGEPERGRAVVEDMRQRLAAASREATGLKTLYMNPAGVTTGPGSLVHNILKAAGLENFETRPGWRAIPLERLAYEQPDMVAAAFFNADSDHPAVWSPMRHPVARAQMNDLPTVPLEGAWMSCGGWFLVNAVEALAEGAQAKIRRSMVDYPSEAGLSEGARP